jgi:uncharacterized protein YdaT
MNKINSEFDLYRGYSSFDEVFKNLSPEEVTDMIKHQWDDLRERNQDPDKAASEIIYDLADWIDNKKERKLHVLGQIYKVLDETEYDKREDDDSKKQLMRKLHSIVSSHLVK